MYPLEKESNGKSRDIAQFERELDEEGLLEARNELSCLTKQFKRNRRCLNKEEYEYRNMLTTSLLIIDSALNRKESRGAHSRSDYKNMLGIGRHSNIDKYEKKGVVYVK